MHQTIATEPGVDNSSLAQHGGNDVAITPSRMLSTRQVATPSEPAHIDWDALRRRGVEHGDDPDDLTPKDFIP